MFGKVSITAKKNSLSSLTPETIDKIRQRSNGVIIKVFDKDGNLVQEFPTITQTAKFYGVERSTIYRYTESGNLWDNKFLLKMELKPINPKMKSDTVAPLSLDQTYSSRSNNHLVEVYDKNNHLVYKFNSLRDAASYLNISRPTLSNYASSGKLWNDLYIFKIHSCSPTLIPSLITPGLAGVEVTPEMTEGTSCRGAQHRRCFARHKFDSISTAAKILGLHKTTIQRSASKGRLCKGVYFFKLVPKIKIEDLFFF
jgi:hypothetical protein